MVCEEIITHLVDSTNFIENKRDFLGRLKLVSIGSSYTCSRTCIYGISTQICTFLGGCNEKYGFSLAKHSC